MRIWIWIGFLSWLSGTWLYIYIRLGRISSICFSYFFSFVIIYFQGVDYIADLIRTRIQVTFFIDHSTVLQKGWRWSKDTSPVRIEVTYNWPNIIREKYTSYCLVLPVVLGHLIQVSYNNVVRLHSLHTFSIRLCWTILEVVYMAWHTGIRRVQTAWVPSTRTIVPGQWVSAMWNATPIVARSTQYEVLESCLHVSGKTLKVNRDITTPMEDWHYKGGGGGATGGQESPRDEVEFTCDLFKLPGPKFSTNYLHRRARDSRQACVRRYPNNLNHILWETRQREIEIPKPSTITVTSSRNDRCV